MRTYVCLSVCLSVYLPLFASHSNGTYSDSRTETEPYRPTHKLIGEDLALVWVGNQNSFCFLKFFQQNFPNDLFYKKKSNFRAKIPDDRLPFSFISSTAQMCSDRSSSKKNPPSQTLGRPSLQSP